MDSLWLLCLAAVLVVVVAVVWQARLLAESAELRKRRGRRDTEGAGQLLLDREILLAAVDHLQAGIVACDSTGRLTYFNESTALLHNDQSRLRVEDWKNDLRGADGTTLLAHDEVPLFRALRGETVTDEEFAIAAEGAEPVALLASGRALYNDEGDCLGAVVAMHDITERRRTELTLAEWALRDELTGLGNRRAFLEHLESLPPATVLLIDLDDFKDINDSLGHQVGDGCLAQIAGRVAACLPAQATAFRLGGDEFVIVLAGTVQPPAHSLAQRVLAAIGDVVEVDGAELETTASIGIAFSGQDLQTPGQLLRAADLALYRAKAGGKGGYALFESGLQLAAMARQELQRDLRKAVRADELTLVYQPIVELATGVMSGVEALVRWTHPVRGAISPVDFIPIAESNGLIVTLGAQVLRKACAQLLSWDAEGGTPGFKVAVNVSTRQLERPGLIDALDECLAAGIDPARLVLEITETALTVDSETAIVTMAALRSRGVQLAVDDFGTGYSSLARLSSAPVSRLKIDRSFVSAIEEADSVTPVVEAIMAMAQGLGLGVVAEGVETAVQLEHLRRLGCPEAQGFLLSRPLPAAEVLLQMARSPVWMEHFGPLPAAEGPEQLGELVALATAQDLTFEELVRPLLAGVRRTTGLSMAYLTRVDQAAGEQRVEFVHSDGVGPVTEGLAVPWGQTLCKRALEEGPRRTSDAPASYGTLADGVGLQSYLVEPILDSDGTLYGTLCAASTVSKPLTQADSALLRVYARFISSKLMTFKGPQ